ncbi:MAG: hypothetical protein ACOZNI_31880 [Myxococcota bacterium]
MVGLIALLACGSPEPAGLNAGAPPDLVIPADNPMWARLDGLLGSPGEYGEKDWDDVRMRVVQHLATIGRDRARVKAARQDWAGCATTYREAAAEVRAIDTSPGVGVPIRDTLARALERDAEVCAKGAGEARPAAPPVDLAAFDSFEDRHLLRVKLVEAWAETVDPLRPTDPWGYWGEPPRTTFTVEGLGALPTGDSYVDVAGFPGPKGIGKLEKLSLDDPEWRRRLEVEATALGGGADAVGALRALVADVAAKGWGSTYYNVKQIRNEGVRVLANRGDFAGALAILRDSWPLHAQDWACPNREGILRGIEGRLLLAKGDLDEAERVLAVAREASLRFVRHTEAREQAGPVGPPPGPNGPPGPPPGTNGPPGPPPR